MTTRLATSANGGLWSSPWPRLLRNAGVTFFCLGILHMALVVADQSVSAPQVLTQRPESADTARPEPTGFYRALTTDWPEWTLVCTVGAILWVASLRQAEGKTDKAITVKRRVIPFNSSKNKQNQMKVTRYASPLHLVIAITVEYLIDNIYFIIVVLFQLFCNCSPTGKHSTYPGVALAWLGKLLLTASEEFVLWRQQVQLNSRKHTYASLAPSSSGSKVVVDSIKSGEIKAGQLILVENDGIVPVDGVVLATSEEGNFPALFNEATLTGESAPAAKFPLDIGVPRTTESEEAARSLFNRLADMSVIIDNPTAVSTDFKGDLVQDTTVVGHFTHKNAAFRGSKLHGSKWALILSVYTAHDTKEGLSFLTKKTGVKVTPLDSQLSSLIYRWNLPVIAVLALAAALHSIYLHTPDGTQPWAWVFSLGLNQAVSTIGLQFVVSFLFLNGLNNLSTKFMGDVVRIGQCRNMSIDKHLIVETNRTIPDTLGCINVIITDKTGTITKNQLTLDTLVVAQPNGTPLKFGANDPNLKVITAPSVGLSEKKQSLQKFFFWMATCNSVLPKNSKYFSSNPDDLEFVNTAKKFNYELVERVHLNGKDSLKVRVIDEPDTLNNVDNEEVRHDLAVEVLQTHEFSSARKYMSTIIRPIVKGKEEIWLVLKGADLVVQRKLSDSCPMKPTLAKHVAEYTTEGHRVLVWAARQLSVSEYEQWLRKAYANSAQPTTSLNSSGGLMTDISETAWEEIEQGLICSGFTVVSDRLQDGVANVITYAKNCGITVVMATGDSVDTAEAIWRKLKQIPDGTRVEKLVASELVSNGKLQRAKAEDRMNQFAQLALGSKVVLILDSETLTLLTEAGLDARLAQVIENFESVVAARMTARQKAQLNDLFQSRGNVTLAIGDGGNDITMIQKASVGVGLTSAETDAAARASDFKIQEFQDLHSLLIHGLQNYFRLSAVYLWNDYKAFILAMVPFVSRWIRNFTGMSLIPGDMIFILTTVVLSVPVVLFGIYDIPITARQLAREANHYNQHRHRRFDWRKKLVWWISALLHASVILVTLLFFFKDTNPLIQGVMAGQMIGLITNVRLIFEMRLGYKLYLSWRILLVSFASAVLVIPISNYNPFADTEQRLKLVGSRYYPKLSLEHNLAVLAVAAVCFLLDLVVYRLAKEEIRIGSKISKLRSPVGSPDVGSKEKSE